MPSCYLNVTGDVLFFADASRLAGGIVDNGTHAKARCMTSGLARLLETLFFDPTRSRTTEFEEIRSVGSASDSPGHGHDMSGLESFVTTQEGFEFGATAQDLGPISTTFSEDDGVMVLNGSAVWRPAGHIAERSVGAATITAVISEMDLTGNLIADPHLNAAPVINNGATLRFTDVGCVTTCPACTACGLCVICGEVNADAAVGTVAGTLALGPQSAQREFEQEAMRKHLDDTARYLRAFDSMTPQIGSHV